MGFVGKFGRIRHRHYEEMCVLAATGQLGGAQMCELDEHIADCEDCRKGLEAIAQVSVQAIPLLVEKRASPEISPPEGMRVRFLKRLAAGAVEAQDDTFSRPCPALAAKPVPVSSLLRPVVGWVLCLAVCACIAFAGFYVGQRRTIQAPIEVRIPNPAAPLFSVRQSDDRVVQLERQKQALQSQLADLQDQLAAAEGEHKAIGERLASANLKLVAMTQQSQAERQQAFENAEKAKGQASSLLGEIEKLRWQLEASKTKLVMQQQESNNLTARLEEAESDLRRELDMKSAKSEVAELIAARNLHIIDVYDADKGKRQPSFGRVFYTEGKSLIFYAYDLEDPRRLNANIAFHVWGETAGVKGTVCKLGILHNDDASQGRWAMTFDDPRVLARINSVFVTAESANKRLDEPKGKKVLYAFFGGPANHP